MAAARPAHEFVPLPATGRRFVSRAEVRLGDTDRRGRLRLDATARMLQDVANDDARDANLPNASGWVVRRTMIAVAQPAVLGEKLVLTTFCGGYGRSWAERRTSVTGSLGAAIETVSLWVQVDVATGRPRALDGHFLSAYGEAAAGRTVSARLALPAPPGVSAPASPWAVRAADLDVFGHVNNAVAWSVVEEGLEPTADRRGVGEVEYPAPLDVEPVQRVVATDGPVQAAWLVTGDGAVRVATRWTPDLAGSR